MLSDKNQRRTFGFLLCLQPPQLLRQNFIMYLGFFWHSPCLAHAAHSFLSSVHPKGMIVTNLLFIIQECLGYDLSLRVYRQTDNWRVKRKSSCSHGSLASRKGLACRPLMHNQKPSWAIVRLGFCLRRSIHVNQALEQHKNSEIDLPQASILQLFLQFSSIQLGFLKHSPSFAHNGHCSRSESVHFRTKKKKQTKRTNFIILKGLRIDWSILVCMFLFVSH